MYCPECQSRLSVSQSASISRPINLFNISHEFFIFKANQVTLDVEEDYYTIQCNNCGAKYGQNDVDSFLINDSNDSLVRMGDVRIVKLLFKDKEVFTYIVSSRYLERFDVSENALDLMNDMPYSMDRRSLDSYAIKIINPKITFVGE